MKHAPAIDCLLAISSIPTASGKEQRVSDYITSWVRSRPWLTLDRDPHGNLTVSRAGADSTRRPLYFTAHLDHPAFVVERIVAPGIVDLSFRGGVMEDYFKSAAVRIITGDDRTVRATIDHRLDEAPGPHSRYLATLTGDPRAVAVGDVGVWDLPDSQVIDDLVYTPACDDLAAAAAALVAFDALTRPSSMMRDPHTPTSTILAKAMNTRRAEVGDAAPLCAASVDEPRLLFTRAEEIGFIGAIAATLERDGGPTLPRNARVLALENSRAFPDSPIGGGPIVRVGDRLSVFSPALTDAVARRAEEIAGGASSPTAQQKSGAGPAWKWQRKLMAGGACEASVFFANGYDATCICLPLGNYHNMADLAAVQAGTNTSPPKLDREFISVSDYLALIDLLIACGLSLPARAPITERFAKLWEERRGVLDEEGVRREA